MMVSTSVQSPPLSCHFSYHFSKSARKSSNLSSWWPAKVCAAATTTSTEIHVRLTRQILILLLPPMLLMPLLLFFVLFLLPLWGCCCGGHNHKCWPKSFQPRLLLCILYVLGSFVTLPAAWNSQNHPLSVQFPPRYCRHFVVPIDGIKFYDQVSATMAQTLPATKCVWAKAMVRSEPKTKPKPTRLKRIRWLNPPVEKGALPFFLFLAGTLQKDSKFGRK